MGLKGSPLKVYGMMTIIPFLIEYVFSRLKKDNKFYSYKTKSLIHQIEEINRIPLREAIKVHELKDPEVLAKVKELKIDTDVESLYFEKDLQIETIAQFITLFINLPFKDLISFNLTMSSLLGGKKIYTEEELTDKLKLLQKQIAPSVKYNEEFFQSFK